MQPQVREKKTKWRVKGKWRWLILFFFLWSELIRVQFYFIFIFLFDPSRSELIRPGLAVRVDPVRLLYLPTKKWRSLRKSIMSHENDQ